MGSKEIVMGKVEIDEDELEQIRKAMRTATTLLRFLSSAMKKIEKEMDEIKKEDGKK